MVAALLAVIVGLMVVMMRRGERGRYKALLARAAAAALIGALLAACGSPGTPNQAQITEEATVVADETNQAEAPSGVRPTVTLAPTRAALSSEIQTAAATVAPATLEITPTEVPPTPTPPTNTSAPPTKTAAPARKPARAAVPNAPAPTAAPRRPPPTSPPPVAVAPPRPRPTSPPPPPPLAPTRKPAPPKQPARPKLPPGAITMPDLRGRSESDAKAILTGSGIKPSQILVQYQGIAQLGDRVKDFPPYAVVSTLPAPGQIVQPGALVILGVRTPNLP